MPLDDKTKLRLARQNFDIPKTSQEQKNGSSSARKLLVADKAAHICYEPQLSPRGKQHKHGFGDSGRRYRVGGTTLISLSASDQLQSGG